MRPCQGDVQGHGEEKGTNGRARDGLSSPEISPEFVGIR